MERKCLICDSFFKTCNFKIKNGKGKYCSRKCYHKSISINRNSKIYIKCDYCDCNFYRDLYRIKLSIYKYCSVKCASLALKKNENV